jgi:dihydroorotate dehydrogenase (NAD+) catalytic subunit
LTQDIGVGAIEINGSCPNAKGLGLQFGQDPAVIEELVRVVKKEVKIPVFFKLTPNTQDIVSLALAAQNGGADGIVAINTLQAMKIDIYSRMPVLTNITGGLSGPAIKPVGMRCVHAISSDERINIPIIAVGGATTHEDVLEYIIAGASAVQVGTSVTWGDLDVFTDMRDGLRRFLVNEGIPSIKDLIGSVRGNDQ